MHSTHPESEYGVRRPKPITIKRGTYVCRLYDIDFLMDMPLGSIRKLWRLMFADPHANRETIQMIDNWLPRNHEQATHHAMELYALSLQAQQELRCREQELAAFGSVATPVRSTACTNAQRKSRAADNAARKAKAAQVKAQKLQTIFSEMSKK